MDYLWVIFTLAAAAGQTARNALQRDLTGPLGAGGATHVRFLFALPFALLFLLAVMAVQGAALPALHGAFFGWLALGALTQIVGTLLMLLTMQHRSFVVSIAFLKMEPVLTAILGFAFLGDPITPLMAAAIALATFGMLLISIKPGGDQGGLRPALLGLASGAFFAASAVGFRGAILALPHADYVLAATFTLFAGLTLQTAVMSAWLRVTRPGTLTHMARAWKQCSTAGLIGALASEFWFLGFALATAASVRTLGMIDVIFAQMVSHRMRQHVSAREMTGIAILLIGGILLVWAESQV
ncbi:MAG: EamA family transporter [Alphaproteobacteria bacterium]|nr:EamA family transporter [Alphaproteobacteria bacterium]